MKTLLLFVFAAALAAGLTTGVSSASTYPGISQGQAHTPGHNGRGRGHDPVPTIATPEPASFVLFGAGLAALGLYKLSRPKG